MLVCRCTAMFVDPLVFVKSLVPVDLLIAEPFWCSLIVIRAAQPRRPQLAASHNASRHTVVLVDVLVDVTVVVTSAPPVRSPLPVRSLVVILASSGPPSSPTPSSSPWSS